MLLTRLGNNSKMVLTGDISQSDLHKHMQGGFHIMTQILTDIDGIGISYLDNKDIVRNPIIGTILNRFNSYENEK
jgi:phosphate starvation-inducible PhoH-like protein